MNRISELRKEHGLKQMALAAMLNVTPQSISRYEIGERDLGTDVIHQLCEIFGVTSDYLLGFSSRRENAVGEEDAALLSAFHAAPPNIQAGILAMLQPYFEQETSSASPDDIREGNHGAF